MSVQYTPGPWATYAERGDTSIIGPNGAMVAHCAVFGITKTFRQRGGDNVANARLIAAAPELLEALQYAVTRYGKPGGPWNVPSDPGGWLEGARAAIAKATGATS